MNSFIKFIKLNKLTRANSIVESALKEKTVGLVTQEKLRVAASLFEEAPKALKTVNSHVGYGRHLEELGPVIGHTARHTNIPSPYMSSPTDQIHHWKGKNVFTRETAHKHYQTFEVPHDSKIHKNEDDATTEHIRKTYPNYKGPQFTESVDLEEAKEKHPVPGLAKWHTYAGGTAGGGKTSYAHYLDDGEGKGPTAHTQYSISPGTYSSGKFSGYHASVWSPKVGHPGHHFLGVFRNPHHAVKAARAHYDEHLRGK